MATSVTMPNIGSVDFTVPRLSALLIEAADQHLRTAVRLREQASRQTRARKWTQPGHERTFSNEELLFDFFREAATGVVLITTALDNLANELMPSDFVFDDPDGGPVRGREELERNSGIELRLSRVASTATGRSNLRTHDPDLWARLMSIKGLRDDVAHAKADQAYAINDDNLFGRLFAADFSTMTSDVRLVSEHYAGQP